jgi:CBS domain-containing protein
MNPQAPGTQGSSGPSIPFDHTLSAESADRLEPLEPQGTLVSGLMWRRPMCVSEGASVEGVTTLLLEWGLSAVAVVDRHERLVGMVHAVDLLFEAQQHADGLEESVPLRTTGPRGVRAPLGSGFHETCLARATVGEIMRRAPTALSSDATVADVAACMTLGRVAELPIVNSEFKVVGIITALDMMRWLLAAPAIGNLRLLSAQPVV